MYSILYSKACRDFRYNKRSKISCGQDYKITTSPPPPPAPFYTLLNVSFVVTNLVISLLNLFKYFHTKFGHERGKE